MVTLYCDNPDLAVDCPSWVAYALTYPGVDNPYPASPDGAAKLPSSEATLSTKATPGTAMVLGGEVAYLSSYEPLADTVPSS